jgi:hypothetical protein
MPQVSNGSCAATCGRTDAVPFISAPFYGMLFTQMALSGLPRLLTVRPYCSLYCPRSCS